MSADKELSWLEVDDLTGAAKGFAEFCLVDIKVQSRAEEFDINKYENAIKVVLEKLDDSASVEGLLKDAD